MSENRHTPGPHTVEQIGRRPIMKAVNATVLAPTGERLADFRHVADANLFAAAPDLLEAMKGIEHFADALNFRDDHLSKALRDWIKAGSAAIAKAEETS